jgi:U3 small nucleolar RNA-associated protein 18
MRGGAQLLDSKKSDSVGRPLAPGRVDMLRLPDANVAEPSQGAITAVDFHSSGSVMLTGSGDSNLRVFRVDGDKNEKQLSVSFDGMAIGRARFLGTSSEIVVSGRRAFFHSYDLESGNISKYPGLHTRGLKSHENVRAYLLDGRIDAVKLCFLL